MNTSARYISGIEVREAPKGSGYIGVLVGHAAVFGSDSLPFAGEFKPWVERIAPGAFKRTLRDHPDVLALWSHDTSIPIGRTPRTLTLREDSHGLHAEVTLIDTTPCRDALAACRAGHVTGWSFGFVAKSTRWVKGRDQDLRILDDVDLHEVSPTAFPAYPGTDLAARSALYIRNGSNAAEELRSINAERDQFFAGEIQRTHDCAMKVRFL